MSSPMRELGPSIWIISLNDIPTASDASLRRSLVTLDGRGPVVKAAALDELIRRSKENGRDEERANRVVGPEVKTKGDADELEYG